jgi:hypothetical protein
MVLTSSAHLLAALAALLALAAAERVAFEPCAGNKFKFIFLKQLIHCRDFT